MRIGYGYDVHRLVKGRKLILGGVHIPYEKGLLGHSDADVLVHAIMDALFGAAALGDIGKHFPNNDNEYKNISSLVLLKETKRILNNKGYKINNIDSIIIAQKPKMADYIDNIRENIASVLDVNMDKISVKATTTEELGFTGTGKGIACKAVVLIENNLI